MRRGIERDSSQVQTAPIASGVSRPIFQNSRAPKALRRQSMPDAAAIGAPAALRVRVAARALAKAGLVHAYGHCSARLGVQQFLVSPPKPLGLVAPDDAPVIVATTGKLPAGALAEVLAHQHIYRLRAEVGGVVRFQSPHVMALSALGRTPRALHGFGSYRRRHPPQQSDPRLVRHDASAGLV